MATTVPVGDMPRPSSQLTAGHLVQLDVDGYVVLPNVMSPEECDHWSQVVDDLWEREHGKPHTYDDEPGVRYVENLLQHSAMFERCATDRAVLEAVRSVLGPDVLLSLANSRRTEPGYGSQPLHELNRRRENPASCMRCHLVPG